MLNAEDVKYKGEKLPSKEERKNQQAEQERINAVIRELKDVCIAFVNEKILTLPIPAYAIEEALPQIIKALVRIHQSKSTKYDAYLKAKLAMEEENLNEVEYVDEAKA